MNSSRPRVSSSTMSKLLCSLSFIRSMGGGPRTFPGGLNKWQWKRMHEKKAKEKERKLLEQEKQLYRARIRSQIRAKLAGKSDEPSSESELSSNYSAMSAKDHVKALADRFMKEGAEDLWNEDDGPLKSLPPRPPVRSRAVESPIDMRKLISDRGGLKANHRGTSNSIFDSVKPRYYSVAAGRIPGPKYRFRRNDSSSSEDDEEFGSENGFVKPAASKSKGVQVRGVKKLRWPRFDFSEGESEEDADLKGRASVKEMMSRATLRNYDMKKIRRAPKLTEDKSEFSEQIQSIRDELRRKNLDEGGRQREEESLLSRKRFEECSISPLTVKALTLAGYVQMTTVQEATLPACLDGKDTLVKAKTGTGKSAAFLIPAIETVLKAMSSGANLRVPPILVLILCPTRELASQIAAEASVMLRYHDGIGVQTLIGGTRFKDDQKHLESHPCQIIVATPGRLLDHIENKSGFSVRLMGLKMLVLDEADHLLDLGFRKDIEKLVDCVPRQRQSLLFSATLPKEVRRISQLVLKREHVFIDTVGLGGVETHDKVKQLYIVAPHELHFQIVHQLLKDHIAHMLDYKVIVFCTTAMVTSLMFLLLRELKMNVREMHSRKPQLYRTRISDEFRESKQLILVTSDVSARGMNYPDVTLVIQVGIPIDREQYIHRLGRTGREGKDGEGILLLAPWEEHFLDEIKDLPIEKSNLPRVDSDIKLKVEDSMAKIDASAKEAAYHAWLGYYNSIREIGRDKTRLVELANEFCHSIGLQKPPSLFRKTASKMGLRDIPGIRIRK
ncbi:putative DEAD-box ATP-dependent RNA helicase 33 [Macadamia integrifolia]|uniref:putative DEAD-box ATP-dependent RNA helicase 33 n=1 Tax=Macadamia integrifolia TaxID=60698 RepID=UPI001C4E7989|nr:putative DEAD-box ATP-dependent RNA helicase 33 [Macadamia integrifolia]